MPALTESEQRLGSADGQWRGVAADDNPNDGVNVSGYHRQVIIAPPALNATGLVLGLAVNVQPGDEIILPAGLVVPGDPRFLTVTFTPAPTSTFVDNFDWVGPDGYGRSDAINSVNTLGAPVISKIAYSGITKLIWRGPNPYVGVIDIGWNNQFGFRFVLGSPLDVISDLVQGNSATVPTAVTASTIFTGDYKLASGRGSYEPTNPVPDGSRSYFVTFRPIKVDSVNTVQENDLAPGAPVAAAAFTRDTRYGNT